MSPATATTVSTTLRRIVELACRAPSVHNTQPWTWRRTATGLELFVDTSRRLSVSDPLGRNQLISCGAALHHAQVAAAALGWNCEVARVPDGPGSRLLARIELGPGIVPPDSDDLLHTLETRHTDRRRFTSWPVPEERLQHLARVAAAWGVHALPVVEVTERFKVDRLVQRALEQQLTEPHILGEQEAWVDRGPTEGVPRAVLPSAPATGPEQPTRFRGGVVEAQEGGDLESSDGVIVFCGPTDDQISWLRAGEALSALWLRATHEGLSVVPLSQVVEVDETRTALASDVLGGLAHPLILVRIGWQPISQSDLVRTARRPVDEVLDRP